MRNRKSGFEPPTTGLIDVFIGSNYDHVKVVADNIDTIIALGLVISDPGFQFASQAWVEQYVNAEIDAELVGLYSHQGGYDASLNIPELLSPGIETVKQGYTYQVTVAGTFHGVDLEVGDVMTANTDGPMTAGDWTIVNRNIDSTAFATSAQGLLADTALQPGANISELTNDLGYVTTDTNTQLSPAEVQTYYDGQVPLATELEMQQGITTAQRRMSPKLVLDAIAANQVDVVIPKGYDGQVAVSADRTLDGSEPGNILVVDSSAAAVVLTLPTDAAVPIPLDTRIDIHHDVDGNALTITGAPGVTVEGLGGPGFASRGAGYAMSLWKRSADVWVVWGANVA